MHISYSVQHFLVRQSVGYLREPNGEQHHQNSSGMIGPSLLLSRTSLHFFALAMKIWQETSIKGFFAPQLVVLFDGAQDQ